MCGIFGMTGTESAVPKLLQGLRALEYRGYDSAGVAFPAGGDLCVVKCAGEVERLAEKLRAIPLPEVFCALGHTRWATHGRADDTNAHPHRTEHLALVHNGILENEADLRQILQREGVPFASETDSEVAAHWIDRHYAQCADPVTALRRATAELQGTFAFGVLWRDRPGELYATRRGSPLLLAQGTAGCYLASDLAAILPFARRFFYLKEGELARLCPSGITLWDKNGEEVAPEWQTTDLTAENVSKNGFSHFMLKEIHEQPDAVRATLERYGIDHRPDFTAQGLNDERLFRFRGVRIVACGSAMHAGLLGKEWLEQIAGVPTQVEIASEFRYRPLLAGADTLCLVISQSGETADTLAALRYAKQQGLSTAAIVNVATSAIAREADHLLLTLAGPEISVATTKGYTTQLAVLHLLALAFARARGRLSTEECETRTAELCRCLPHAMEASLSLREELRRAAKFLAQAEHLFYIGRGQDDALCREGSLKLKEISYLHSEALPAGELKHGTISLITEGTPVVALCTDPARWEKLFSNLKEVTSRGGEVWLIATGEIPPRTEPGLHWLRLPEMPLRLAPFGMAVALQLLAFETALFRGCAIDRPRNLAKSVTVE